MKKRENMKLEKTILPAVIHQFRLNEPTYYLPWIDQAI